eukprot:Rmarinus@m.27646
MSAEIVISILLVIISHSHFTNGDEAEDILGEQYGLFAELIPEDANTTEAAALYSQISDYVVANGQYWTDPSSIIGVYSISTYEYYAYNFTASYDTSPENYPPKAGGSGWAMWFDGEGDTAISFPHRWPEDDWTISFWIQPYEIMLWHSLFDYASETNDAVFTVVSELMLDEWIFGEPLIGNEGYKFGYMAYPNTWTHISFTMAAHAGEAKTYFNGKHFRTVHFGAQNQTF